MAFEMEKKLTKVYQQHMAEPAAVREARCIEVIYPACLPDLEPDDYFAGRTLKAEMLAIGFSPDVTLYQLPHGMGFFYRKDVCEAALAAMAQDDPDRAELEAMMAFWDKENTTAHVKAHYTDEIRKYLPSDAFAGDVGVGFPLYRMTGAYENYEYLVKRGIPGLHEDIARSRQTLPAERQPFMDGLDIMVDVLSRCCKHYADQALALAKTNPENAPRLNAMANDLIYLMDHAPATMCQAIQLHWLYSCIAGVMDYGRMDVVFGGYLAQDLESGVLTEQTAQDALCGLWRMMVARKTVYHGRVVIGGMGRPNEADADRFALMAMEASAIVADIEPQLTMRFYEGQNPALMDKALEVIGKGCTYPMLYNDDVNVPAVMNAFRLDKETSEQYVPFGCGEYIIDHRGFGSPNGVINMLKALEVTLFGGRELLKGAQLGLDLGCLTDYATFDDLYAAYLKQIKFHIEVLADAEAIILRETGRHTPFLLMSLLYDGCIEKGLSMLDGGIDFLGATLESYGNINTVDSLAAIRWAVYDKKLVSAETLMDALRANFEGYEDVRAILLRAPKYGNDDPYVDDLACHLHDFEARTIREQADRVGMHSFLMVVINNSANTSMGHWVGASADGRLSRSFMANANNPVSGMDKAGITAMLNTLARFPAENHAGVVQNMKFSRDMFNRSREKVSALLRAYFRAGGTQAMITVVGREDLEKALANPDQYRSLLVRVGGFSARFVELEPDVQQEVLTRTCY